jgi:hypothetical protein
MGNLIFIYSKSSETEMILPVLLLYIGDQLKPYLKVLDLPKYLVPMAAIFW